MSYNFKLISRLIVTPLIQLICVVSKKELSQTESFMSVGFAPIKEKVFTCQKMVDANVWFGKRRPTICGRKSLRELNQLLHLNGNVCKKLTTGVPNGIKPARRQESVSALCFLNTPRMFLFLLFSFLQHIMLV